MSNFVEDVHSLAMGRESDLLQQIDRLKTDLEQVRHISSEAMGALLQQLNTVVIWIRTSSYGMSSPSRSPPDSSDQGVTVQQSSGGHGNDSPTSEDKALDSDAPGEVDLQVMQKIHFDPEQHDEEHEKSHRDDDNVM